MSLSMFLTAFIGAFFELYYEISIMKLRFNKWTVITTKFILSIVSTLITSLFWYNMLLKSSFNGAILLIYYFVMFKDRPLKKLFYFLIFYVCIAISESLAMLFSTQILKLDIMSTSSEFSPLVFVWITVFLFIYFISIFTSIQILKRNKPNRTHTLIALYNLTQIITIFILTDIMTMYKVDNLIVLLLTIGVIIISFIVGYFILKSIKKQSEDNAKKAFLEKEIKLRDMHYSEMQSQYAEYRKLRHDFANHISTINTMQENNENVALDEYVKVLQNTVSNIDSVHFCDSPAVDAMLFYKNKEAINLGIDTKININLPINSNITAFDICSIISNLFQNAIEACKKLNGNRYINIEVFSKMGQYVIIVKNSSNPINDTLGTTKKDKERHGIGLEIVKSVAKKYNGNTIFEYKNDQFVSIIALEL